MARFCPMSDVVGPDSTAKSGSVAESLDTRPSSADSAAIWEASNCSSESKNRNKLGYSLTYKHIQHTDILIAANCNASEDRISRRIGLKISTGWQ